MQTIGEAAIPPDYNHGAGFVSHAAYGVILERVENAVRGEKYVLNYWDPGRLVRGVLNHKIEYPEVVEDVPGPVTDAMRVAVGIHAGMITPEELRTFAERAGRVPGLLESDINHTRDSIGATASSPALSTETACEIHRHTGKDDILLIALGNGGITAGAVTYLDYARRRLDSGSALYPVRFSTRKSGDTEPQLNPEEEAYLEGLAADRPHVVVFDEDVASGRTLNQAAGFFNELLGREVIPAANSPDAQGPPVGMEALLRLMEESGEEEML